MAICVLKSANEANNMNPSVQRVSVFIVKGENKIKKTKRNPKCDRNELKIFLFYSIRGNNKVIKIDP